MLIWTWDSDYKNSFEADLVTAIHWWLFASLFHLQDIMKYFSQSFSVFLHAPSPPLSLTHAHKYFFFF